MRLGREISLSTSQDAGICTDSCSQQGAGTVIQIQRKYSMWSTAQAVVCRTLIVVYRERNRRAPRFIGVYPAKLPQGRPKPVKMQRYKLKFGVHR